MGPVTIVINGVIYNITPIGWNNPSNHGRSRYQEYLQQDSYSFQDEQTSVSWSACGLDKLGVYSANSWGVSIHDHHAFDIFFQQPSLNYVF